MPQLRPFQRMSDVFVTGAHGFIGRHVSERLAAAGAGVYRAGQTSRGGSTDIALDLHDPRAVDDVLRALRPAVLVHTAWTTAHGVFWSADENARWVQSSIELVRSFLQHGGRRFVGVGTCAEYAWHGEPLREDSSPLRPESLYGAAKLGFATLAEPWLKKHEAGFAWARVFHIYGPGEGPRKFMSTAIAAGREGTPLVARDPGRKLDYVHVDDVARALATLALGEAGGAFNIGSGTGVRIAEALAEVERALGRKPAATAKVPGTEPDVIADVTRARRELGWEAEISLSTGIAGMLTANGREELRRDNNR